MNVLVTGAAGFLGGHICAALRSRGHHITALGRREGQHIDIVLDLVRDTLDTVDKYDAIIHCASVLPSVDRIDYSDNIKVVEALETAQSTYHLLISSVSIFPPGHAPHNRFDVVDDQQTAYGASKLAQERALRQKYQCVGVIRPSSIYGPGMKPTTVLPIMLRHARSHGMISVLGPTSYSQNFVFVRDLAILAAHMVEHKYAQAICGFSNDTIDMLTLAKTIQTQMAHAGLTSPTIVDNRINKPVTQYEYASLSNVWPFAGDMLTPISKGIRECLMNVA